MDLSNLQVADFIKSLLIADSFIANLSGLRELRPYRNFAVFTGHEPVETALVRTLRALLLKPVFEGKAVSWKITSGSF